MKTVLIIEDSMYMRSLIKIALNKAGYQVIGEARDGQSGIKLNDKLSPDIITLDNILPDMFGIEVLKHFHKKGLASRVIVISAVHQDMMVQQAKKLGAGGYVAKPFETEDLISVANAVAEKSIVHH